MGSGAQAQYLTIPEDKGLITMPENLPYEQATASTEGAHYAYNFINKVNLQKGQKVLVNGASGAIGSAAVQLLKYFDIYVTAVCNTKNIELIKSLGADIENTRWKKLSRRTGTLEPDKKREMSSSPWSTINNPKAAASPV